MKSIFAAFLFCLLSVRSFAGEENTIFESVVKVHAPALDNKWGTGTCINLDDKYVYIITNDHVISDSKQVSVQFYRQGHESKGIPASVIWTAYIANEPIDIALLAVDRKNLDWTPTVVKFELDDKVYKEGDTCLTIGCPKAAWPRAYKGHIAKLEGGTYLITPTVVPGQSGSVLFNADGTKAIGLIAWQEGHYGKAMTAEVIRRASLGKNSNYYLKQSNYNSVDEHYNLEDVARLPIPVDCHNGMCDRFNQPLRLRKNKNQNQNPNNNPNNNTPNDNSPNDENDQVIPNNIPPGGGIKIFPTYPYDDKNPQNTAPLAPQTDPIIPAPISPIETMTDPKITDLQKRVDTLESNSKNNNTSDLTKQISDVSAKVDTLAAKVNAQPPIDDIVTPGKLADFVKSAGLLTSKDINNLTNGLNKSVSDANTAATTAATKVDAAVDQNKNLLQILQTMVKTTAQTTIDPNNPINNVYNDYGKTAVGAGIPSIVVLILGWLFKKFADKHMGDLIGLLGGVLKSIPFPQSPVVGTTQQPTQTQASIKK